MHLTRGAERPDMKSSLKHMGIVISLGMILLSGAALAYAPEGELMRIKGYSPEVIKATDTQRSRQEWRQPAAPRRSNLEKFFHNIYYGEWTEDTQDMGYKTINSK